MVSYRIIFLEPGHFSDETDRLTECKTVVAVRL